MFTQIDLLLSAELTLEVPSLDPLKHFSLYKIKNYTAEPPETHCVVLCSHDISVGTLCRDDARASLPGHPVLLQDGYCETPCIVASGQPPDVTQCHW